MLCAHDDLPTRLLDWTNSPLAALHFATSRTELYDRDGAVWMIDYVRTHELAPRELRDLLVSEGAVVFSTEMLESVAPALTDLEALADDFAFVVEPPSFDERIVKKVRALHPDVASRRLAGRVARGASRPHPAGRRSGGAQMGGAR
jgi:FRG domain